MNSCAFSDPRFSVNTPWVEVIGGLLVLLGRMPTRLLLGLPSLRSLRWGNSLVLSLPIRTLSRLSALSAVCPHRGSFFFHVGLVRQLLLILTILVPVLSFHIASWLIVIPILSSVLLVGSSGRLLTFHRIALRLGRAICLLGISLLLSRTWRVMISAWIGIVMRIMKNDVGR